MGKSPKTKVKKNKCRKKKKNIQKKHKNVTRLLTPLWGSIFIFAQHYEYQKPAPNQLSGLYVCNPPYI